MNMNMLKPLAPGSKQQACDNENSMLPGDDCFYQYEIQDAQDKVAKRPAFFGHKVLGSLVRRQAATVWQARCNLPWRNGKV